MYKFKVHILHTYMNQQRKGSHIVVRLHQHIDCYRYTWYAHALLLPVACLWTVSHSHLVLGQSTCGCNTSLAP